jgi:acyl-CoA synthetase (AMP-forming)/AMP-acid ligase II
MIVRELIERGAVFYPRHTAAVYQGQRLTFAEVYQNSLKMANALLALGLRKGDRVASLLGNSLQSIEIDFALLLSGLVRGAVHPCVRRFRVAALDSRCRECRAARV